MSSLLLLQACSSDIQPNIDRLESVIASNGTDFEYWFDQAKILDSTHIGYYAEIVFSEPKIMSEYCSTYKRIEKKYEHMKAFYLKISSDFQPVFDQVSCEH